MDQINFNEERMKVGNKNAEDEEIKRQNMMEARRITLRSILTVEAQERLNRISSVKPEKATLIENYVLQKYSRTPTKISDEQLKQLIEAITKSQANTSTIRIQRKKWDSDEEY
ncbi:uncharacterized protein TOT_030000812 [Theileria orientalis strain Shintoku]|uniref:DNA-binding protein n=1 Tax=Theileria orientalis strain Shintoku TaxID=869250 RepID=J4DPZ2_THEOR|nr:uncharacterized protein TOT_030000812 [Theileria orientalis strain Shintoku]BAM41549.1 uncharacterized protein TOT_030000812 [Theileria orientalis strain Shintoku]|eukprot:XP_009691850.1 uncharacterized protein TOT_030000812 [Theileria orientalis strain Shintoku]